MTLRDASLKPMGVFRRAGILGKQKFRDLQYPSDMKEYLQIFTNRLLLDSILFASLHACTNGLSVTDIFSMFLI